MPFAGRTSDSVSLLSSHGYTPDEEGIASRGSQLERKITYFEVAGKRNTEETLRLAIERAHATGIKKLVLASTTGDTARTAAERLAGSDIRLVVVPHQHGFTETQRFSPELVAELEQQGHRVHFGTMLFHTERFYGVGAPETMAILLRTVCQGMKVCVEIVLMAADAGLVAPGDEVVVISGTARGADTAVVALAAPTTRLHELHITEIVCKPLRTRSWARGTSPYDPPTPGRRSPEREEGREKRGDDGTNG